MTGPEHLTDLQEYVTRAAAAGELVVQPRMGMASPQAMAAGLRAVGRAQARAVGTITLDSYTRVGDHDAARRALRSGRGLNGYPLVAHGAQTTAAMLAEVAEDGPTPIPIQVRHGSAVPGRIFRTAIDAGLTASEGGPVSYCLPYGRTPLAESIRNWDRATVELAEGARSLGARAHLETFGGCMLGQLCPPSMLIALSVLEAAFFAQRGVPTVSLSYAQQTDAVQDVEALAALRLLAAELLPERVDRHLVLYTYMGVYPRSVGGAQQLLDVSTALAVRGRAERLIVKTSAEAERIPTVAENVASLERASRVAAWAAGPECTLPWAEQVDCSQVLAEARALVGAVTDGSEDLGKALLRAFANGILDVPFCLHRDNLGLTQTRISDGGRLEWARTGRLPLPSTSRADRPVSARRLLTMLRTTADDFDHAAIEARPPAADPYRIAIVGSGPRGIAVLERLAARLAQDPPERPVEIHVFDPAEIGCGRIWRTDQPSWYLMNTVAGEVTMFSGPRDDGPARPGAGPSLAEWWQHVDPDCPGADGYAPRPLYGRYLRYAFDAAERGLPAGVTLRRRTTEVVDLTPRPGGYLLTPAEGDPMVADRVVLTTGHPRPELDDAQQGFADFAESRPELHYIRGDSASDMPLDRIGPGATVGVLGLGLSFYDVLIALTVGRGGRFVERADDGDELDYLPAGTEPILVAGSRSGVPIPARGRNQKPVDHVHRPRVFTRERILDLRRDGRLDFRADVLPLLVAEMELVYYGSAIRDRFGEDVAERFTGRAVTACVGGGRPEHRAVRLLAAHFGADGLPPLDLEAFGRPFAGRRFADRAEFDAALVAVIEEDLRQAEAGNVDGPLKAAFDVLRDTRGVLRAAADFSGLAPDSHREDFLAWFAPLSGFLAAGPPLPRLRQVKALIESGVLRVVGPSVRFAADPDAGRFTVSSPRVRGATVGLDALVDARIPVPDLSRDRAPLPSALRASGLWTSHVNADDGEVFDTGGVAVTGSPFHPLREDGLAESGLHVLGIPTEHTRWFTQVGSGRPGAWTEFTRDADAVAKDVLAGVGHDDQVLPSVEAGATAITGGEVR